MLRQSVLGLFLFFSLLVAVAFAGEAVSGEVLVVVLKNELGAPMTEKLLNGVEARLYVARVASGVDARVACTYGSLSEASDTIFAFLSPIKTTEQLIAALEKCPEVLAVSPNYRMQTMGGSKVLDVPSKEVNVVKPETEQNVQKPSPGKTVSEDVKEKTEAQKRQSRKEELINHEASA